MARFLTCPTNRGSVAACLLLAMVCLALGSFLRNPEATGSATGEGPCQNRFAGCPRHLEARSSDCRVP